MKKECTKDLYERPETEEIEIQIENICGFESGDASCLTDDPCPQDFEKSVMIVSQITLYLP